MSHIVGLSRAEDFSPKLCLCFTVAALVPACIPASTAVLMGAYLAVGVLAAVREQGISVFRLSAVWAAPLAIPLFVVHGVINPGFSTSADLSIPIRPEGVEFALTLTLKLALFTLGIAVWRTVTRDRTFDALISSGLLPQPLVVVVTQSIALTQLLEKRAKAILLAQQARGIPVRKNFARKVVSLPALVVPMVVHTLIEADVRASALISRGLGSGPIYPTRIEPPLPLKDQVLVCMLVVIDGAALALWALG